MYKNQDPGSGKNIPDPPHIPELILTAVFRIRIHVFFGLPDPDSLVRGMDPDPALDPVPDPSIIMQN
jgi:hypothetical protein